MSTALPTCPTLTLLELRQQLARLCDLALLPLGLGVPALVVAAEQQHNLRSVEVHIDPKEHGFFPGARAPSIGAEHVSDLVRIMADPKFVKTFAECFEPLGSSEVKTADGENVTDGGVECDELEVGQSIGKPFERDGAVVSFEHLRCPDAVHPAQRNEAVPADSSGFLAFEPDLAGVRRPLVVLTLSPRGGAVWKLVGLITRRSQVQILPPPPRGLGQCTPFVLASCT